MKDSKVTFGRWEAVCLLIAMISAKSILDLPRTMAQTAGTAGWILILLSTAAAFLLFFFVSKLFDKFEGKDIIDIAQTAAGPFGRITAGVILMAFIGILAVINLRGFSEQMKIIAFNRTPITLVMFFFIAPAVIGAFLGVESITRFQAIWVPIIVVSYVLYIIMLLPNYDISNLFPVFGNGPGVLAKNTLIGIWDYAEMIFLFLLYPYLKNKRNFQSTGYISVGLNAFFFLSITLAYTLAIPYPINLQNVPPVYQLGRMINYSRFFQRIEALFVTTWSFVGLMYISTSFYFTVLCFKKAFLLKDGKPVIAAFAVIIFTLGLLPGSLMDTINYRVSIYKYLGSIIPFGLTFIVLLAATARKKAAGSKKRKLKET